MRDVVLCSLAVTAAAALVALPIAALGDARWSLVFVYARWLFVLALLITPLLHQLAVRRDFGWRIPWVLATPATALLLTCEGIAYDIASVHFGG